MRNSDVLAELILFDDKSRSEILDNYKNICYFTDSEGKALKLTVDGKKYKLVVDFPSDDNHYITITLVATVSAVYTIDRLDSVSYKVHETIGYAALIKFLKALPNHVILIPKERHYDDY